MTMLNRVRHAYQNDPEQRTVAWRNARYYRTVLKAERLLSVLSNPHSSRGEVSAAMVELRHAAEEQKAVLHREARA